MFIRKYHNYSIFIFHCSSFIWGCCILQQPLLLHIGPDGADEDVAGDHTVFCGEALGEIVGVQDLGIGGELVVAFPHQDLHLVAAHQVEAVAGVAVLDRLCAHLLSGGL